MTITHQHYTAEEFEHFFIEACEAQSEGRFTEARAQYQLLLRYFPDAAILRYNIGLVHYSMQDFPAALEDFTLALASKPDDSDTLFNLALCQKKTGDDISAIDSYRHLLVAMSDNTDCWYNLAGCYRDIHDDEQAIFCYRRVLELDPVYLSAVNNLAYLYHRIGDVLQAEVYYRQVLVLRPEDDSARYMLASLLGTPLDLAPDSYVRDFFDTYAEGFEKSLVDGLGYDNPRQLFECFHRCAEHTTQYAHGLDLGCGTGLSGVPFLAAVTVLDGVDLSGNMLAQAADKGCYTELYHDSITHHLQITSDTYDFFLATDVFIYVGELLEIFRAVSAVARPSALFCFSTETLDAAGYKLKQTGRFAYSHDYIHSVAAATGWTVLAEEETRLRKERGEWIDGDLWILKLTGTKQ